MTGFRIMPVQRVQFPKAKAKKSGEYRAFVCQLPCCITGVYGVEAAHLSFADPWYGSYGRGRGTKIGDRWVLPLSPEQHRKQHSMSEQRFWDESYRNNPHVLALTLWGLWSELGDDALDFATAAIVERFTRSR